jgi:hypothetical protein
MYTTKCKFLANSSDAPGHTVIDAVCQAPKRDAVSLCSFTRGIHARKNLRRIHEDTPEATDKSPTVAVAVFDDLDHLRGQQPPPQSTRPQRQTGTGPTKTVPSMRNMAMAKPTPGLG